MRRSFRTHRLCAIPGVSPRAGMPCPVGALRTLHLPRAPTAPSAITTTLLFNDNYFSSWATIKPPPFRDRPSSKPAAAGSGRSEHRNVDILIPVARPRESLAGPNVPCERRTDPAEPRRGTDPQAPAPALRHRKTGHSTRVYAAFLQNAPVVRHTRGFTPGWYAVPPWGTPNASPPQSPHRPTPPRPHHNTSGQRRLFFLNGDHQTT
jgi:hypothetical protein